MAPDDRVASTLAEIKERYDRAFTYEDWFQVGRDAHFLLAAVEAVLALANKVTRSDWWRYAAAILIIIAVVLIAHSRIGSWRFP